MNETEFRPLRSVLYLPASNTRAIEKSRTLPADALVFDLEDAVAPDAKAGARANLVRALGPSAEHGGTYRVIRPNETGSPYIDEDLAAAAACRPDAVLLPKVGCAEDIATYAAKASAHGLASTTALWCMIESVSALTRIDEIASAGTSGSPRVECLVVGTNDIVRETGVSAESDRLYLLPWLMNVVLAAKRHGVRLLDGVWNDFKNLDGFRKEAVQARGMGFDGKTLIHPGQIEPANEVFSPTGEALAEAREIVAAFEDPANEGRGVINLNGRMVELLHLEMARRTLRFDAAIRKLARGA